MGKKMIAMAKMAMAKKETMKKAMQKKMMKMTATLDLLVVV